MLSALEHLFSLTRFKNRVAVLANRTIAFVGGGRPKRAITEEQLFGREALEREAPVVDGGAAAFRRTDPPTPRQKEKQS